MVALSIMAKAPDDVAPGIFGPALVSVVIPKYWKDLQAMHFETRIAYSTLHAWKSGSQEPRLEQVKRVAETLNTRPGVHVGPLELLGALSSGPVHRRALGSRPDWPAAEAKARKWFRHLTDGALAAARETVSSEEPDIVTPEFVRKLAEAWMEAVLEPDDD
jgi:hypothetical protein